MALTAPGIGSNLDVNGLVTQLMAVEKRPLTLIQKREANVTAQISAFGQIKSQIATFGDAAAALGTSATMSAFAASVADTDIAGATAGAKAVAGSYSLEVRQLAQTEKVATTPFGSASSIVGLGDVVITLGTNDTVAHTFVPNAARTALTLHLSAGNNSLTSVRDQINAAQQGVSASIVTDSNGARLVISSSDTGAVNAISISAPTVAGLAYDPTSALPQSVSELQPARDAKIRIDTMDIVSASNQVTGAIEGVTINLLKAKPDSVSTLTVAHDNTKAAAAIKQFVTSYNALNSMLRDSTKFDPTSKAAGILQGDVTAVGILSQMRSLISGTIPGGSADFKTMNEIGVSLQTDGSLKLDDTKLTSAAATAAGSDRLSHLFVSSATNTDTYATRIKSFVDKMQNSGGILPSKVDGLTATSRQLGKDQAAFNARMVGVEARLRRQFNALDANLASQNAVTAYLTSQDTAWTNAAKNK